MNYLVLGLAIFAMSSMAQIVPQPPKIAADSYLLMEATTGEVLLEFNGRKQFAPASLTKIMTTYVAGAELEAGRLALDDEVPISIKAWRTEGSKMFIQEGTVVPVLDLLRGIIVVSGNDACVALGEFIGGTEEGFADLMNLHGDELGLTDTHFVNSTGLDAEGHLSSAYDHANLSRALIRDFPEIYEIYRETEYTFNEITQPNRNNLLYRDPTIDGVKTGFTSGAGYNLVASAKRDGMRLISVILGAEKVSSREAESRRLLNYGFRMYELKKVVSANEVATEIPLNYGIRDTVPVVPVEDIYLTLIKGYENNVESVIRSERELEAPIAKGQKVAEVEIKKNGEVRAVVDLVANVDVEEKSFFPRIWEWVTLQFKP